MESFLLQLIYEMHQVVGESFRSTFERNWTAICAKLTGEEMEMGPSFGNELKVLNTLKKNIFYKPPPQDVVEVNPVSYALAC